MAEAAHPAQRGQSRRFTPESRANLTGWQSSLATLRSAPAAESKSPRRTISAAAAPAADNDAPESLNPVRAAAAAAVAVKARGEQGCRPGLPAAARLRLILLVRELAHDGFDPLEPVLDVVHHRRLLLRPSGLDGRGAAKAAYGLNFRRSQGGGLHDFDGAKHADVAFA
eukprot:CAMPEP_0170344822 /NCGR_PEP_ID=MMETSP0116_2-20130129/73622_1 /TAXON_ID=400756 /ORGANISM="Durinskia baltica, Strain CSIRO CS-38" /LENGTH=168 /DNA_ID=CAMNT_0010598547 /DNA_START=13 /DNA_END=516 /DNA_ORIENTATION=-